MILQTTGGLPLRLRRRRRIDRIRAASTLVFVALATWFLLAAFWPQHSKPCDHGASSIAAHSTPDGGFVASKPSTSGCVRP